MYDILVYLSRNCQRPNWLTTRARAKKLSAAGSTTRHKRSAALAGCVLRAPHGVPQKLPDSRTSFRAFAPRELEKLDANAAAFS